MKISQRRRVLLTVMAVLPLASPLPSAWAQADYPARAVTLIIPFPPGSGADTTARLYARRLQELTKQSIVVDNRPGGETFIAAQAVTRANPDGYTLYFAANNIAMQPALFKKLPYDPIADFVPVARMARGINAIVVPTTSPYKTLAELAEAAKKKPRLLTYGAGGSGFRLYVEQLSEQLGVQFQDIPYKGAGPALVDTAGGVVNFSIADVSAVLPLIHAGKLRALVVSSERRHTLLPDVPSAAEAGVPGYEVYSWTALLAPAKTPQSIVEKLAALMQQINAEPETVAALGKLGIEIFPAGPQELRRYQLSETERWKRVAERAGVEPQ
ncbi:Bug family tripartite tricarboxylate transporter substrate binding protein [Hydrogenophaga sp. OTU3427]|uniref:Bug family tripartite tricarboxylate transporter substrate binding protein n=1 Tax=Hydrogenophaga sp. OTU3427 TaxID=3043856 RepID=UPI00313BF936